MSSEPTLSAIMATYNAEAFISESMRSVLAQDFEDFELIVVDDGSSDRTAEVVRSHEDRRIRYVRQENRGPPAARNTGIRAARGRYMCFTDHDDLSLSWRFGATVHLLDQSPAAGMVFSDFGSFRDGADFERSVLRERWLGPTKLGFDEQLALYFRGSKTCADRGVPVPSEYREHRVYEGEIDAWLASCHPAWGCAQTSRLDAVRAVGGMWEAIKTYDDWALSAEISKRHPLIFLDVPCIKYRVHDVQITGKPRVNSQCYRDAILRTWRSDERFYTKHKRTVDRALATAYDLIAGVEASECRWADAEANLLRALFEDPTVGKRPYANLLLATFKNRVPFAHRGPFKRIPGRV